MDNQHRKINGYRELSQDEIDLINKVKSHGEQLRVLCNELKACHVQSGGFAVDLRWLAIGETDLQKGIMSLVRSVAVPDSF